MKTLVMLMLMCAMAACAVQQDAPGLHANESTATSALKTTWCDPISGQCWVEDNGPNNPPVTPGEFECVQALAPGQSQCGQLAGYDAIGGAGIDLATDTWVEALGDPNYNPNLGDHLVCVIDTGTSADQVANCLMSQGPWRWNCVVHLGASASTCCRGAARCPDTM
jgi:hypothetical protein